MNAKTLYVMAVCHEEDAEALIRKLFAIDKEWNEAQHKRDRKGRFSVGGSGSRAKPSQREGKTRQSKQNSKFSVYKPKDITDVYKNNATPGRGRFEIESGVDEKRSENEIRIAKWLFSEFGGDIKVLREKYENKNKDNPDYEWNGKLWDLKTPDRRTYNALNKRPRKGIEQIRPNPGGIIMDLGKCGATIEEAEKALTNRMNVSADFSADAIILHKDGRYKVIRYDAKQ